jgi:hypothetical protein
LIEIPRLLARQLWAVLRRCVPRAHGLRPAHVEFQTGPAGLTVRLAQPEIAVEYRQPGAYPPAALGLPLSALARFEGRGQDLVALEAGKDGPVIARWQDGGIPQMVEYTADADTRPRDFPDVPSEFVRNPPALLHALDEASKTTATEGVRFALHCLQLRGRSGEVVATDGKQLLLQGGFQFPWQEDLLIPRLAAFGCKELATDQPVEVGRQNDRVVLRSGCWTFFLHIDADARYPQADQVIPKLRDRTTTWRIAAEDAVFLARALPRLPGGEEDDKPLTVDLNGSVCVRARSAGQGRPTEVVLARSSFEGQPVRFAINRQFLGRILQLGFDELSLFGADRAVLAQDNQRTLVVMPLPKEAALAAGADVLRIVSAEGQAPAARTHPERKKASMTTPARNGNRNGTPVPNAALESGSAGLGGLIAEAQALQEALRAAYGRSNRLVAALRRNRKQTKWVAATLAGLKQLQQIES